MQVLGRGGADQVRALLLVPEAVGRGRPHTLELVTLNSQLESHKEEEEEEEEESPHPEPQTTSRRGHAATALAASLPRAGPLTLNIACAPRRVTRRILKLGAVPIGTVLNLGTATEQKCEVVQRRARI